MTEFMEDYYRTTGKYKNFGKIVMDMIFHHNLRFLFWLRSAEKGKIWGKVQCYRYSRKYGLEISTDAKIGKGLYLGHPYNITVGSDCVIGENVNLHKGCTIGQAIGKKSGSPIIGNSVWIGINATVVGKITIGDDVVIAQGAFVNFNVPSHSVVLGNPGTIHSKENATDGYLNFKISI